MKAASNRPICPLFNSAVTSMKWGHPLLIGSIIIGIGIIIGIIGIGIIIGIIIVIVIVIIIEIIIGIIIVSQLSKPFVLV